MANVVLNHPNFYALTLSKKMKRALKRPKIPAVGMFKRHESVTETFDAKEMASIDNLLPTTEQDFPVASDFPGSVRFVVAQEALNHLERNLATFRKIFVDFRIQKSDYRLLAGFDEDLIRDHLGFLNQIHVLIRFEPSDITSFLSRLSPALEGFSAVVFTDKSTYRIPPSLPEFHSISRRATHKTTRELPSCVSTLSQGGGTVTLTVGGPGIQNNNRTDGSRKKGKERERNSPPDPSRTADGDIDPESPGPDGDDPRNAVISFRVISHLHRYDQPRAQGASRGEPFQKLQVQGTVKVKRVSESQDPCQFAVCEIEFAELCTTLWPVNAIYRHFQLDVRIDAKEKDAHIREIHPVSMSKFNPELKISHGSKKAWNMLVSATLSFVKPQGTLGASGSRTGEQSTSTERTTLVSRIIQSDIGPTIFWSFHIADPFDQNTGLTLSSEKRPHAHFQFLGKMPAPPPKYLTLEISTYWSLLSSRASISWLSSEDSDTPSFSNLCKIIMLDLPSHLQGSHNYHADLLVWPEHSNLGTTVTNPDGELENGVGGLMTTKVVKTDHKFDSSI